MRDNLSPKSLGVRPHNILVAVHDPNNLTHLAKVLGENDPVKTDIVVLSVNADCPAAESENPDDPKEVMNACETKVFSKLVYAAEKAGKPAHLVAVPGKNAYELILLAANRLRSSHVVMSLSEKSGVTEQARQIADAWGKLPHPKPSVQVEIMPDGEEASWKVELNQQLFLPSPADMDLAHRLWWNLTQTRKMGVGLHEGDIFGIALRRFADELRVADHGIIETVQQEIKIRASALNGDFNHF